MVGKRRDTPQQLSFDGMAPPDERYDAQAEMQKAHRPLASALLPPEDLRPVIAAIEQDFQMQAMRKARNVIPFPGPSKGQGKRGMQSVYLDDMQIFAQGEYFEKAAPLGFDSLRSMVEQTPVLNAVVMTRIRQISRFTRVSSRVGAPGFEIAHRDPDHRLEDDEHHSIQLLERFFVNCGWEFNPRRRKRLKRDNFTQFLSKLARDSLTMDSAPIETEFKRDRSRGIDGFYAVDGSTIRLCTEDGYEGDDEIFAVQLVEGRIATAYSVDDLIYEPRNPRADVRLAGYGLAEPELLVRVVTGFLNAMTYNIKGFDDNAIPHGMLHLAGDYDTADLTAFKNYWNAMVQGINNAWTLPVMVSKDQDSRASFERFGVEFNEMYFSKWMTFLTSLICAIYGISPDEINFESFSASRSALSGSDTEEKLADSKDKGLVPLMSYLQSLLNDYICADFGEKYQFRWTGLDEEDEAFRQDLRKQSMTVNEARAITGDAPLQAQWGEAPLNRSLIGAWQQEAMGGEEGGEEDFGDPGVQPTNEDDQSEQGGQPGEDQSSDGQAQAFGKAQRVYSI